jgi:quercetin dioxygenase-like cupin family protein
MRRLFLSVGLIALIGPALAQDGIKPTMVTPDTLTWQDAKALPKGAQFTILMGDPTKAGEVFVQRVKLPPNYQVPAHIHPYAETATVISGTVYFGMGEKLDMQNGTMLKPGSFFAMPPRHAHYAWTTDEGVVVQVQATGPGGIEYINPADDPRK